jgi:hypothetical protein
MAAVETETDGKFGREAIESSQGFRDMPMAHPDPPKDLTDFSPDESFGPKEAARFLTDKRREETQQAEPLHRDYIHIGGEKSGEPRPANEVVELDRAARDISGNREVEETVRLNQLEADLIAQLDAESAQQQPEPQQAPEQPQQPQEQPPQPALENVWERPEVIQAVSEYNNHVSGAVQQMEAKYMADLQATASQATAAIFSNYPELQNLQTQDQLRTALGVIDHQNPQRGAEIRNHITNVSALAQKAQEAQQQQVQAQQQQHRQAFDHVAAQADDAYDAWIAQQEPDAGRRQEISTTAKQMLRDAGLSEQELAYHWQTSPILRSFTGQQILADAARYRMAQQGVKDKTVRTAPTVQRPGSPAARSSEQDYDLSRLQAELDRTGSPKAAAALVNARRAARR